MPMKLEQFVDELQTALNADLYKPDLYKQPKDGVDRRKFWRWSVLDAFDLTVITIYRPLDGAVVVARLLCRDSDEPTHAWVFFSIPSSKSTCVSKEFYLDLHTDEAQYLAANIGNTDWQIERGFFRPVDKTAKV